MSQEPLTFFIEDNGSVGSHDLRPGKAEALVRPSQAGAGHLHDRVHVIGHMLPRASEQRQAEDQGLARGQRARGRLPAVRDRREIQGDLQSKGGGKTDVAGGLGLIRGGRKVRTATGKRM